MYHRINMRKRAGKRPIARRRQVAGCGQEHIDQAARPSRDVALQFVNCGPDTGCLTRERGTKQCSPNDLERQCTCFARYIDRRPRWTTLSDRRSRPGPARRLKIVQLLRVDKLVQVKQCLAEVDQPCWRFSYKGR